jgi:methionyl aminopeptidase
VSFGALDDGPPARASVATVRRHVTIELKTPAEIDAMREAGRVVARCLEAVRTASAPGVTLKELDTAAHDVMREHGAVPAFLDYHPHFAPSPYPGVICSSVNDAVVHAIPGDDRLAEGDLVSIDIGAFLDGWCGDAAISYVVGPAESADPADLALIDTTERALYAGIAAARPGNTLGDIGAAVAGVARPAGYGMLADHGGHGVGRAMHEQPHVPNEGRSGKGLKLRPGLVIAIEPMLHAGGGDDYRHDPDGWTLRTADGSRAAHAEHTIAITPDGPRILTEA